MTTGAREQFTISPANAEDLPTVRELFVEYATWLGADLSFQGFDEELETLPGKYRSPDGLILLARTSASGAIAGCVALRRFDAEQCEMKRLWVREPFRTLGVGRILVSAIVDAARHTDYRAMVLDTLESMVPARHLYESFGFGPIEPYYYNPLPGVVYLGLTL
jgi:ribosomal protein S18 acetylase RimI-like enzyme